MKVSLPFGDVAQLKAAGDKRYELLKDLSFRQDFLVGTKILENTEQPCWAKLGNFLQMTVDRSYAICVNDTTSTTTTTTTTVTTVRDCSAGQFTNSSNLCQECAAGTFKTRLEQQEDPFAPCTTHSGCTPPEVVIAAGAATYDTLCGLPDNSHCTDDQYVAGNASVAGDHTWVFKCAAAAFYCPWPQHLANDSHTLAAFNDTAAGTIVNAINNAATSADQQATGEHWVRVCTAKTVCAEARNEYVVTNGSQTSDRTCSVCPKLCAGINVVNQPDVCPSVGTDETFLAHAECLKPPHDNSDACCRVVYDRARFVQNITSGGSQCEQCFQQGAATPNENAMCSFEMIQRGTIPTTTTTTVTTYTVTTTTLPTTGPNTTTPPNITTTVTKTTRTTTVNIIELAFNVRGGKRAKRQRPRLIHAVTVLSVAVVAMPVAFIAYLRYCYSPPAAAEESAALMRWFH
jgi:hypothetical protein